MPVTDTDYHDALESLKLRKICMEQNTFELNFTKTELQVINK